MHTHIDDYLVFFRLCILRLPLGIFPLPLLALEKGLYFREQDTGQSLHLMVGYPGAVVVGVLLYGGGTPQLPITHN